MLDDLGEAVVTSVIAVNGDTEDRTRRAAWEWGLQHVTVGYGQNVESMRSGLFVSNGVEEGRAGALRRARPVPHPTDGTVYARVIKLGAVRPPPSR